MNRVVVGVAAVLAVMVVAGSQGRMAVARAAQSSPAVAVLPPVPTPAAVPTVVVNQPRSSAVSSVNTATPTPAAPSAAAPSSAAIAAVKAQPSAGAAAPQPQASPVVQQSPPAARPGTAATQAASTAGSPSAAGLSPASAQAAGPAHGTAPAPHQLYAAIPQNAAAVKPAAVPVAAVPTAAASASASAVARPAPAKAVSAPSTSRPAATQPAAAPTALAAILPPSAAHTDYPRLGGITTGERMHDEDDYAMTVDPANWIVRIFKHKHRLEVYYRDNLYKSYHAVFGRSLWPGAKEIENDRRTPEGAYMIVGKHPSRRFGWFLKINYPNEEDRDHFEELRDERRIPSSAREGGQVGIHGTDNPLLNVGDVNWTTGCISIDNQDIEELAQLLPIGTVVIIKP